MYRSANQAGALDTGALLQHCHQSPGSFKVPKRVLLQREALQLPLARCKNSCACNAMARREK